ncbi:MAG: hypothetical protein WDN69_37275 [Aliidongia sp.]
MGASMRWQVNYPNLVQISRRSRTALKREAATLLRGRDRIGRRLGQAIGSEEHGAGCDEQSGISHLGSSWFENSSGRQASGAADSALLPAALAGSEGLHAEGG